MFGLMLGSDMKFSGCLQVAGLLQANSGPPDEGRTTGASSGKLFGLGRTNVGRPALRPALPDEWHLLPDEAPDVRRLFLNFLRSFSGCSEFIFICVGPPAMHAKNSGFRK